jgi:transposase
MHRYAISDDDFDRIAPMLPGQTGKPGRNAANNRLFIDAVLWIARTGAPWEDLPERFGKPNTVYKRFSRWGKGGLWQAIHHALQDPDLEWLMLDGSVVRAHQHAAGQKKVMPRRRPSGAVAGASQARSMW